MWQNSTGDPKGACQGMTYVSHIQNDGFKVVYMDTDYLQDNYNVIEVIDREELRLIDQNNKNIIHNNDGFGNGNENENENGNENGEKSHSLAKLSIGYRFGESNTNLEYETINKHNCNIVEDDPAKINIEK